jgi:integrase
MPRLDNETHVRKAITEAKAKIATGGSGKRDALVFDSGHKGAIPGFGLRVFASGAASFTLKFALKGGKTRRVSLGEVRLTQGECNLQRMRQWASEIKDTARVLGRDIYAELETTKAAKEAAKLEAEDAPTLRKLAPLYLRDRERGRNDSGKQIKKLKPKSLVETRRYLEGSTRTPSIWDSIARVPLARITTPQLRDIVEKTATTSGAVTADRARVALSGFFAWAIVLRLVDSNPTNDLAAQSLNTARDRTLSEPELVEVWKAAGDDEFGKIVKLLMLTGSRRAEVGDLAWSEIDLAARRIELPAHRCKNNRPHLIPLSDQALAILKSVPRSERNLVFGFGAGGYSGWSKRKRDLDARTALAPWTLHDIRRSVVTHLNERGLAQPHIIEATINHLGGYKGGVAGVYNRAAYYNEKRDALQRWADHLAELVAQSLTKAQGTKPEKSRPNAASGIRVTAA